MNLKFHVLFFLALLSTSLSAALICPPDITITCHDDIDNMNVTGMPTVFGGVGQLRYFDQSPNNFCNVGNVVRTWYIDANANQLFDTGEHACIQKIKVLYTEGETYIDFPPDRQYNCNQVIANENPTWVSGPCDIIGVSKTDQKFDVQSDVCYKILRNFTVINWCTYHPNDPDWNGAGIWTHTQIIKVGDQTKPVIKNCFQRTLSTNVGCESTFEISNSAIDVSPCGQETLLWTVEIDLWADGTIDYVYGFNKFNEFKIDTVKSNQSITIKLPHSVRTGYHYVNWKVRDLCGNNSSCIETIQVKDDKKPTPYVFDFLTSSFEGNISDLRIPARIFNIGSFDNCTKSSLLRYSFSPNVNDSIRVVNCNNAGFQFFTLYITDMAGNQETVDVFMLVYDNGSCSGILRVAGKVSEGNGRPVKDVMFKMERSSTHEVMTTMSGPNGQFAYENISIYNDMEITPECLSVMEDRVDVADMKLLQDYILGNKQIKHFQYVAADVDRDNNIRIRDLEILRNMIINPDYQPDQPWRFSVGVDSINQVSDLAKIQEKLKLVTSGGKMEYKAVYVGDITNANDLNTKPRTQTFVVQKTIGQNIQFFLEDNRTYEGIQLEISLPPNIELPVVTSSYFSVQPSAMHYDASTNTLRLALVRNFTVDKDQPFITLTYSSDDNVAATLGDSKLLAGDYQIVDLRVKKENQSDSSFSIYPNPANDTWKVSDINVSVKSIKDVTGRSMKFTQSGQSIHWEVSPGVYWVSLQADGQELIKKVVRL